MKKTLFLAAATLLAAAPLQAQSINLYGLNACWTNSTYSDGGSYASVESNCSVSDDNVYNTWGEQNDAEDRSYLRFSRSSPPGAPQGNFLTLNFANSGDWQVFSLGAMTFYNADINSTPRAILSSTMFNMALFFDNTTSPTLNYTSQVIANVTDNGGTDQVVFDWTGANDGWVAFSSGGHNYEFRVIGFDDTERNVCTNGDFGDIDILPSTLSASNERSVTERLCGKMYYRGATQVAEPATMTLVAAGLLGLVGVARRRREV